MGSGRHAIPLYATRGVVAKAADGCERRRRTPHRSCGAQRQHQRRCLHRSPDSQWIVFQRVVGAKLQLAKMKPVAGATAIPLAGAVPSAGNRSIVQWSGGGDWIAYQSPEGISMISPDGNTVRKLTGRKLSAFAFSKDGNRSYGIFRNRTGEGAQWQLYSIDVKTGAEKMLAPIDLPASVSSILGFSLHPDGKRFLTSVSKWPFDIWMLEGWDQPQKTWLDRLLRR